MVGHQGRGRQKRGCSYTTRVGSPWETEQVWDRKSQSGLCSRTRSVPCVCHGPAPVLPRPHPAILPI